MPTPSAGFVLSILLMVNLVRILSLQITFQVSLPLPVTIREKMEEKIRRYERRMVTGVKQQQSAVPGERDEDDMDASDIPELEVLSS